MPMGSPRTGPVLDVAASSQDEMKDWVQKIREVTMTSEAKVCLCWVTYEIILDGIIFLVL